MRPRLFTLLFVMTLIATVLHGGNLFHAIWQTTESDGPRTVGVTPASAQADAENEEQVADKEIKDAETAAPDNKAPVDPLAPRFSAEEVEVLQSLSERRKELEAWADSLKEKERFLEATEQKITEKVDELKNLKNELQALIGDQQDMQDERMKRLVKIYETMKPKDAARIFNDLRFDVLLSIVDRMSERRTAPILAEMEADKARFLSAKLAEQKALPYTGNLDSNEN